MQVKNANKFEFEFTNNINFVIRRKYIDIESNFNTTNEELNEIYISLLGKKAGKLNVTLMAISFNENDEEIFRQRVKLDSNTLFNFNFSHKYTKWMVRAEGVGFLKINDIQIIDSNNNERTNNNRFKFMIQKNVHLVTRRRYLDIPTDFDSSIEGSKEVRLNGRRFGNVDASIIAISFDENDNEVNLQRCKMNQSNNFYFNFPHSYTRWIIRLEGKGVYKLRDIGISNIKECDSKLEEEKHFKDNKDSENIIIQEVGKEQLIKSKKKKKKNTILILTHTAMYYDDRIKRQANALASKYKVILFARKGEKDGFPPGLSSDVELIEYATLRSRGNSACKLMEVMFKMDKNFFSKYLSIFNKKIFKFKDENLYFDYYPIYQEAYRDMIKCFDKTNICCDIKTIIANDVFVLPIADRLKRYINKKYRCMIPLIGDMHELHFEYSNKPFNHSLGKWLCSTYIPKLSLLISFSDQVTQLYKEKYDLSNAFSIINAPNYENLSANIQNSNQPIVKLVHMGGASPDRRLETMIQVMQQLDTKYELYFHLTSNHSNVAEQYLQQLRQLVIDLKLENRVYILEPIEPDKLIKEISKYDIGIYYLKPQTGNQKYALPNKFFQFIQARLGVVINEIGEIPKIINKYDVGIVPKDYKLESFAKAIEKVSDNLSYYKIRSDKASKELNSEYQLHKLIEFVDKLTLQ